MLYPSIFFVLYIYISISSISSILSISSIYLCICLSKRSLSELVQNSSRVCMILVPVALYHWCFSAWTLYSKVVELSPTNHMKSWVTEYQGVWFSGWFNKKTASWGIWSFAKTAAASEPFLAIGSGVKLWRSWGLDGRLVVSNRLCKGFMLGTGAKRYGSCAISPRPITWCRGQGECLQRTGLLVLF